jgi:signal transduction histidine kinase
MPVTPNIERPQPGPGSNDPSLSADLPDVSHSTDVSVLQAEVRRLKAELERVELALEAAQMEASATQESKERFLSQVAHELRTPLSAIVLWSSLIEDEKVSDPKHLDHAIDAIRTSAEEQRVLIDNLLEMSRILAGKIDLEQKRVDLGAVVHAAVENARSAANPKSLTVEEIVSGPGAAVRGDAPRLERALGNLLTNAIQVAPNGSQIKAELRTASDWAEISVTDNGPGFAAELLPLMLRGAPTRRRSSVAASYGLGLPTARKIAELHGGVLVAESAGEGRGARFTLRLPLLR